MACVSRSTVKISPTPPRRPANATVRPSGEKLGDSGSSTDLSAIRASILRVSTFCTISVRSFSVRTK